MTSPPGRPARQGPRHQPAHTRSRARRPGAQIRFEGRGYGARPDPADPRWQVAPTLRPTSSDSRYSWLDGALAVWEGEFNEAAHHPRYQAFLQQAAPAADPPAGHPRQQPQ